jgi:hypothetical protein
MCAARAGSGSNASSNLDPRDQSSDRFALETLTRPLNILVGNFGSGKSELAVNLAFALRAAGRNVVLGDLDLVKPYFRCRLVQRDLEAQGISLVAPGGEHFYADLPILVPQIRAAAERAHQGELVTLFDVGGDDIGARVLGSLSSSLIPDQTDILFVVNVNRPFAEDEASVVSMVRQIEAAARLRVSGLVSNTHLMEQTTFEMVLSGLEVTCSISDATGIPVRFCSVPAFLEPELAGVAEKTGVPFFAIDRHILPPHVRRRPGSRRSLAV